MLKVCTHIGFTVDICVSTMAARRVRIKGIANIPIRRKNDITTTEKVNEELSNGCVPDGKLDDQATLSVSDLKHNTASSDQSCDKNKLTKTHESELHTKILETENDCPVTTKLNEIENIKCSEVVNEKKQNLDIVLKDDTQSQPENKFNRRWAAKPSVRIPSIPRKIKSPTSERSVNTPESVTISTESKTEEVSKEKLNIAAISDAKNCSDNNKNVDNSLIGALSPNKHLNRARIRPVPRFIRRTSIHGSASESEDDARKSQHRTRNDSVCSISNMDGQVKDDALGKEKPIK